MVENLVSVWRQTRSSFHGSWIGNRLWKRRRLILFNPLRVHGRTDQQPMPFDGSIQRGLVSCVIATCLALQVRVMWGRQPARSGALYWPFVDYPMYAEPHRFGDTMDQYVLWGELEDATNVRILPKDLGLSVWQFSSGFVEAVRKGDRHRVQVYAQMYDARHRRRLISLRLENHRRVFREDGVAQELVRIVYELRCSPDRE